ncbi:T-cell leukemia translocation-altered gene protein homolog isoform X1 [Chiloscyllium punctatum]|uniref:T-cell leukemia translocation-altered gene protein homolog isoform X1 n=1 Tax=Chiloscyllium punctatum TaxID=137246 RepID=UPI003B63F22D
MEAPSWDLGLFSFLLERLLSFCSEFAQDWSSNDMRVTIFKILLGWLLGSLVAIHMAWKFYGATVNDMYYRQDADSPKNIGNQGSGHLSQTLWVIIAGIGGQNGGTPDSSSNFTSWDNASGESIKSHRE